MKYRFLLLFLLLAPCLGHANCLGQVKGTTLSLEETVRAHNTAQQALITIRRNAQDWKNLLLRGNVEKDRQILLKRFEEQSANYELQLKKLDTDLSAIGFSKDGLNILNVENKKLNSIYQDALTKYGIDSLDAASKADRFAQGADIKTFRTLEKLDSDLAVLTQEKFKELNASLNSCFK